ncbi:MULTISPECIES: AraC family transcriptional regulator [unclassified Gilliamella]|uniref:AraC family transcriptional regulator n=1 Tax=unclassified Gilliamella TaxID=2685620 RepID=UPI00226AFB66|nr:MULTISPECIES: AraC family transcriptional regulator [unclassified Gilliamella]MCX8641777.1 AraC family transcriptional regulator [Gilliamella sp. B3835]MCX8706577.1 AraC family transcriptional regulator [Gilliamella sp. B3783]MCX8708954.1 AraC family transcriptional regulator [Gilliamella sp. B3780]MCX8714452.1 AraC family transcriptional regulator [Gilliamella sp. B3781]MCX8715819.1 AraC family transcriptional regulator [Gilliamella sp. B3784]
MKRSDLNSELTTINQQVKQHMLRWAQTAGDYPTAINGLGIYRRDMTDYNENCFYQPLVSIIIQGSKRSLIGTEQHIYGEGDYLVTSVDIPAVNSITIASQTKPFLSLALYLNTQIINQLITEYPQLANIKAIAFKGISIKKVELDILTAFFRLIQLLDKPEQISILAPMIIKEIHYLLLIGPFGQHLRSINTKGTQSHQIASTIDWLKNHYKQPITVEALAEKANMSLATFHRHFKQVTTLSPLQYQKQLRLYEARRLMLSENYHANSAGLEVGYESQTQFNREYKRLFGTSPYKDIKNLQ